MRWKEGSQGLSQGSAQLRNGVNLKYYLLYIRELNTKQKDGEG